MFLFNVYHRKLFCAFLFFIFFSASAYSVENKDVVLFYKGSYTPYQKAISGFVKTLNEKKLKVDFEKFDISDDDMLILDRKFDYIIAMGTSAVEYASENFPKVPIVFSMVLNPVESGIVKSIKNPGKKITGVSLNIDELRQFKIAMRFLPEMRTIGMLYDRDKKEWQRSRAESNALRLGLNFHAVGIDRGKDIKKNLLKMLREVDCLWAWVDPLVYNKKTVREILTATLKNKKPFIAFSSAYAKAGAFLAFEADYYSVGSQTARLFTKILDGKAISACPVQSPVKVNVFINKRTMKLLKIKISEKDLSFVTLVGD